MAPAGLVTSTVLIEPIVASPAVAPTVIALSTEPVMLPSLKLAIIAPAGCSVAISSCPPSPHESPRVIL